MSETANRKLVRGIIYLAGMVLLALGITLNSLTGLGASAIVSVPFTISETTGWNFGNLTLLVYCLFVLAEFLSRAKTAALPFCCKSR